MLVLCHMCICSPLAEPYFSRIRKSETPQYVYQHENLFENQHNSVNCKAISSKNSSTANSMDEFDSCSSYCTDSFSSPKMHKKVKEGTSKA